LRSFPTAIRAVKSSTIISRLSVEAVDLHKVSRIERNELNFHQDLVGGRLGKREFFD